MTIRENNNNKKTQKNFEQRKMLFLIFVAPHYTLSSHIFITVPEDCPAQTARIKTNHSHCAQTRLKLGNSSSSAIDN